MAHRLATLDFIVRNQFNVRDGKMSHSSMDGIINGIWCPMESLREFRQHWAEDVCANKPMFYSEYGHSEHFRAFMDIDLKLTPAGISRWTPPLFKAIIHVIQTVTRDVFSNLVSAEDALSSREKRLLLLVLRRNRSNKNDSVSFGYHLHWPNLTISTRTAIIIRSSVLKLLDDEKYAELSPPGDESWSAILDEQVYMGSLGPHIRGPLCHKCTPCTCQADGVHCTHRRGSRKRGMLLVPDSLYEHVVTAVDHNCERLGDIVDLYGTPREGNDASRILRFINATSIRTETERAFEPKRKRCRAVRHHITSGGTNRRFNNRKNGNGVTPNISQTTCQKISWSASKLCTTLWKAISRCAENCRRSAK